MLADAITRVLVHVQAHLEEPLPLAALAEVAGASPYHFAREFTRHTGETVKQYTQRLRLERAAVRLLLHDATILDVALECGFASHETFTRAFHRRFGVAPRVYRERGVRRARPAPGRTGGALGSSLSATAIRTLDHISVAFLRHTGPYEQVSDRLWQDLSDWAADRRIPRPHILLGIAHDAPGITLPAHLRFDAALRVPDDLVVRGRIAKQTLPGGTFAVTTFVGPYSGLPAAYRAIVERVRGLAGYRLLGVPTIEVYQTTRVDANLAFNHTDIYLPIARAAPHARAAAPQ